MNKTQSLKTVMIVEDEIIQTLLLKKFIVELGYTVIAKVSSAEEAVRVALEYSPDIITMDIFLEGEMDGISAVEEIHKYVDIPIIYISGNSDTYHYERARKTDFVKFLSKPVSKNELAHSFSQIGEPTPQNSRKSVGNI